MGQVTNQPTKLTYGLATNGIRGEVEIASHQDEEKLTEIIVWVNHVGDTNLMPDDDLIFAKTMRNEWDYYMATNSFCGPVEVRDAAGRIVPLVKPKVSVYGGRELLFSPQVSSLLPYPETYNILDEHERYFSQFMFYSGPGVFPMPLFFMSKRTEMVRFQIRDSFKTNAAVPVPSLYERTFQLHDYFDLKTPGEYQFTVWPKLYNRSATNGEIYLRIDVPPVTGTFKVAAPVPR